MNLEFLHRSYRSALVVLPVVGLFVFTYLGPMQGAGFALAALLGIVNVRLIEECAVQLIRVGGPRKLRFVLAALLKLVLVYGIGALLLIQGIGSPAALVAGFSMIFAVIVLKAAGRLYVDRTQPAGPVLERKDSR